MVTIHFPMQRCANELRTGPIFVGRVCRWRGYSLRANLDSSAPFQLYRLSAGIDSAVYGSKPSPLDAAASSGSCCPLARCMESAGCKADGGRAAFVEERSTVFA